MLRDYDLIWIAFYAHSLKGPPGASSNGIVRLSVQYCNFKSLDGNTVDKFGLKVNLRVAAHTFLTSDDPVGGVGSKYGT